MIVLFLFKKTHSPTESEFIVTHNVSLYDKFEIVDDKRMINSEPTVLLGGYRLTIENEIF